MSKMSDMKHTANPGNSSGFLDTDMLSYMRCPLSSHTADASVDVVVTGVPYDLSATIRPGTRFGPEAVRRATRHLSWELRRWPWNFHVFDLLRVIDAGDLRTDLPIERTRLEALLQRHASQVLAAGKIMLTLGGDHYIALPLLREHAKLYGPVSLIHFDAHADTEYDNGEYHHGTMFRHAMSEGIIDAGRSVQVGIRTEYDMSPDYPFTVLDAAYVNDQRAEAVAEAIVKVVGDRPAYISFDIDCLDPAFAPGTGTPVVGGLSTDKALKILRGFKGLNLIGMDLVEVSPAYDPAEITALAAATISLEFLYVLAAGRMP